ncbi:MAG: hypothetical protein NC184_00250 [Roseburia sp.]|nr:hypothetical protein [Roseburia sp.]
MSFIDQAAELFGNIAELKFQAVLFGRGALYLEGAKPLKIDGAEMIFRARGCVITVSGSELSVKDLTDDCVSVIGVIDGISVKDL